MDKIAKYLRIEEWMSSKVTMMLGAAIYFTCINQTDIVNACKQLAVYFLFLSMFLAFSYVLNDFVDMEIDKRAEKKKIIAELPRWEVWMSFFLMAVVGICPIMIYTDQKIMCGILVFLTVLSGAAYSLPGIHFKERGLVGLVECAFAQRCMPLTLLLLFFEPDRYHILLWTVWMVLSFADGLRYILIHQYIDKENDRKTGVHTYVSDHQVNIKKGLRLLFAIVILGCTLLILPLLPEHRIAVLTGVALNILLEFCIYEVLNVFAKGDWLVSFDSVPMEAFLNILMPVLFGVCMMKINAWAFVFSLFILACCFHTLKIKVRIAMIYVRARLGRS